MKSKVQKSPNVVTPYDDAGSQEVTISQAVLIERLYTHGKRSNLEVFVFF